MTRELFFNVGGDCKDDEPYILPDNPPGHEHIPLFLLDGATPPNRARADIPAECTGGADVFYQHGSKRFRVILPPVDKPFQAEAGEAPQLPPEYNGDADQVALHYAWGPATRKGLCRVVGYSMVDDDGFFFPLGTTLMWALHGYKFDRSRVLDNVSFAVEEMHCDYLRILGQVDWKGQEIGPSYWPDYEEQLTGFLNDAYARGARTQITVTGGGPDPLLTAQIVRDVVAPYRERVIALEAVNEANASVDDAVAMVRLLRSLDLPVGVGLGNQGIDEIEAASNKSGANVAFYHSSRIPGEHGERRIRQCWDFKEFKRLRSENEPAGPGSSVFEETDPHKLAAKRAADIICGAAMFVLHTGSGVFGRTYQGPTGMRYANLWDIPNIRAIADAVKNAETGLSAGIELWAKFNTNHPIDVTSGLDSNSKLYGSKSAQQFAEVAIGCTSATTFRARVPALIQVRDPALTTPLWEGTLAAGQSAPAQASAFDYVVTGNLL